MLTHANFSSNIKTLASIIEFNRKDYVLSFLPLSHVLERMVTFAFLSARQNQIPYREVKELIKKAEIEKFILEEIDRSTPNLAPYEKVKKVILLERDFDFEKEEMTPTLKVKRKMVEEKFRDALDLLYKE